jgi:hypothetical protein
MHRIASVGAHQHFAGRRVAVRVSATLVGPKADPMLSTPRGERPWRSA